MNPPTAPTARATPAPRAALRRVACLALSIALAPGASGARAAESLPEPDRGERGPTSSVSEVVDGDTLVLENAMEVRLVGIQTPKLPLGRRGFPTWPLADAAKRALEALSLGRRVTLHYGGRRTDRHGRQLAHLFDGSGTWVQGELLARGMARVYSFADNRALIPEMLVLERAARTQRRGIWDHPFYRVRGHREIADLVGSFQLVEGRVVSANLVRGRAYLNFDADWRTDFTVSIEPRTVRLFRSEGLHPEGYQDRRVRVRGWLKRRNGPMIEATHPEQIEILAD